MALRGCIPTPVPPGPEGELMTMLDLPYKKPINNPVLPEHSEEICLPHSGCNSIPKEALTDTEVSEEGMYLENLVPNDFVAFKVRTCDQSDFSNYNLLLNFFSANLTFI